MTRDDLRSALDHPNVQAFLRVIREGESGQTDSAYSIMFGGGHFSSFADHPRIANSAAGLTSTAAGAYQFLSKTWDGLVAKYGFQDFSPACQDEAAVALIAGRGALQALLRGDISDVLDKCSYEWASLPPGRYGQPTLDAKRAYATYDKWLQPNENEVTSFTSPMPIPAIVAAVLPSLVKHIPDIWQTIRDRTQESSEQYKKAGEKLAEIAIETTQAVNEQEAAAKLEANPELAAQFREAAKASIWQLLEVGPGIKGAQEANLKASESALYKQPAFVVSVLLLPLVYYVAVVVLQVGDFSQETKAMVVAAIITGVLGGITGFFLGSSVSSRAKDEVLLRGK